MLLEFEDADGESGRVTEDLAVEYDGQWEDVVIERVEETRESYRVDDGDVLTEEALDALIIELPKEPRIVEAERHHS